MSGGVRFGPLGATLDNHPDNGTVPNTPANVSQGTIGFLTEDAVDFCSLTDCVVAACTFPAVLNHSDAKFARHPPGRGMSSVGLVSISGGSFGGLNADTPSRKGLFQFVLFSGSINDVTFLGLGCPTVCAQDDVGLWQLSNVRLSMNVAVPWLVASKNCQDEIADFERLRL